MTSKKTVEKYIDTLEAVNLASREGVKVTTATIRNWCQKYPISKKVGRQWIIIEEQFLKLLNGDYDVSDQKEKKKKS